MYSTIFVCSVLTTLHCQFVSVLTEKQPLPVTLNGTRVKGCGVVGHKLGRINRKGLLKKELATSNDMIDKKTISTDYSEKNSSLKRQWLKHFYKHDKLDKKKKTPKQLNLTTSRQTYDNDMKRVAVKQRFWKTKWFKNLTSTTNEHKSQTIIQQYFSVGTCFTGQEVAHFNGPDLKADRCALMYQSNGLQKGDSDGSGRITTNSVLIKTTRFEDQVSDAFSYSCHPFTPAKIARTTKSPTFKIKKTSWSCRPPTEIPVTLSPRPSRMKSTIARCVLTLQTCKPVTYADPGTKWFVKVTSVDPWVRDRTTESDE